ncbi:MAG: hypothetical protein HPY44_09615 [Armatimonadetes bacterium]|nr:hypothetical protein [Armatimonadota bacterium]
MRWLIPFFLALTATTCFGIDMPDGDMELPETGPWSVYGTPSVVEKSDFARTGARSLRVVTDNVQTMGGNYEGTSRALGRFEAGDLLRVSFWYWVREGKQMVVGIGPTYFIGRWVLPPSTDWTRADLSLRIPQPGSYTIWLSQTDAATEFFVDDFSVELVRRPELGTAPVGRRISLTGGPLRVTFCPDTGALAGIENLGTGEVYAAVGERRPLFSLQVLDEEGLGYQTLSFEQMKLTGMSTQDPQRLELSFRAQELPVSVTVTVRLSNDGAAHFGGRVTNDSHRPVMAFELPMVYGICPARDPEKLTLVHPYVCGQIVPNAIKSTGCQTAWPGRGVMGWMDLSGEQGGVYLATHDPSMTGTRLMALPAPGPSFDMSLTREIVVKPGETWDCPESVLAVHQGDWHASADRYRAYSRSWMKPPDAPQWMHDANGWLLIGVQNGVPFHRIPDVYRTAQWMGIEYLHVQGQGIDNMWFDEEGKRHSHALSYLYPSPKFGTPAELKDAIRRIHDNDGHVMFYYLYERWTPSHDVSDDFGTGTRADVPEEYLPPGPDFYPQNALIENPGGVPATEHPFMAQRMMCLGAPGWQEWMRRWAIDIYLKEYGADGFYWDVMGRGGPFRCFNERHGHQGQNDWAGGCAEVLDTVTREGRAINPDYSSAIEGCSDVLGQWVGYHLMSGATMTPNVFRYTFPDYLLVDGFANTTWKLTHPEKAHRVFLNGERFDITGYDARVKRIINLRRRIKPFIDWPAVFKDTVGLELSDPRVQARAFWRTDGRNRVIAVTMMNEEGVEGAQVTVDLSPIGAPKTVHVFGLDGRVEPIRDADATGTAPDDFCVLNVPTDPVSAAVIAADVEPKLRVVPWLEQIMRPGEDGMELSLFCPMGWLGSCDVDGKFPPGELDIESQGVAPVSTCLRRARLLDRGHLRGLTRWSKIRLDVTWDTGTAGTWCVLAPPLVNGDFEEVEDGRLVYWGAPPCEEDPGEGKWCIRLDRDTAPLKHVSSLTPLKPNTRYRFRCMIRRSPNATQWAGAHVVEYLEGSTFERSAVLNSTRLGEWETLETVFTSHPDPRSSAIYLYNFDENEPAWFDGLELTEVRE